MAAAAGGTFLLDQLSKWLVVHRLGLRDRGAIDVVPPWVNLRMAWNEGVNFGLGAGLDMRWVLVGVAVAISAVVVAWVRRDRMGWWAHLSAGLLVGGAMGNVVDRVLYGAVADFLNLSCCGIDNPYAFNVADVAVFGGALGLVLFAGGGARGQVAGRAKAGEPKAREPKVREQGDAGRKAR
jgi:signal peptidase II